LEIFSKMKTKKKKILKVRKKRKTNAQCQNIREPFASLPKNEGGNLKLKTAWSPLWMWSMWRKDSSNPSCSFHHIRNLLIIGMKYKTRNLNCWSYNSKRMYYRLNMTESQAQELRLCSRKWGKRNWTRTSKTLALKLANSKNALEILILLRMFELNFIFKHLIINWWLNIK
jgi:hypothetical protein